MRALCPASLALAALLPLSARAIVGGSADTAHPAAVAVWVAGTGSYTLCSGVLVHPSLLLTLAYCVSEGGAAIAPGRIHLHAGPAAPFDGTPTTVGAEVWLHPAWAGGSAFNVALVRLADAQPASAVATLSAAVATAADVGSPVTLVGYGPTAWTDTSPAARRAVATTIEVASGGFLSVGADGSTACLGDMGAPVFAGTSGQVLRGVVVNAALGGCAGPAGAVDAAALRPFVEAHRPATDASSGGCGQSAGGASLAHLLILATLLRPRRRGAPRA